MFNHHSIPTIEAFLTRGFIPPLPVQTVFASQGALITAAPQMPALLPVEVPTSLPQLPEAIATSSNLYYYVAGAAVVATAVYFAVKVRERKREQALASLDRLKRKTIANWQLAKEQRPNGYRFTPNQTLARY